MLPDLIWIPVGAAVIYALASMAGGWRRLFVILGLSYAAAVLTCQHYHLVSGHSLFQVYFGSVNIARQASISFALTLLSLIVFLHVSYGIFWKPGLEKRANGLLTLLRGIGAGAVGWAMGVWLMVAWISFQFGKFDSNLIASSTSSSQLSAVWNLTLQTNQVMVRLVQPWLVSGLPSFLLFG